MTLESLAADLFAARATRTPIGPIRLADPSLDIDGAYAIQKANIDRLLAGGAWRVGRKIGLTSLAVQKQLGVDQPDFGVLLDGMVRTADRPLDLAELIAPRIEGEIVFRIGRDITEPGLPTEALAGHVEAVAAGFEIVDSAIAGWDISIIDTIADNASCGVFVIGPWQPYATGRDLKSPAMTLTRDGEVVSTGSGAASLGDPLQALAWLAETAIRMGDPLRASELVLGGALGPMIPLTAGDYDLAIDGFPPLRVRAA
ncbi:fumarylacetoacetate hydrolase family protein [Phenylobacterium sp.]|uniref:2-keto-4-pentenoate hydratase n=1 Tax=Phenylobacterium sp. TaxID=1871053 RepID=UPI002600EF9A|nr:fumarylacetoacetate hydrolase family protein [Phenylobacterium sp.]MBX3484286.1 fumarylacetoacetate hydrolase family protein [Phenylobacterium sp.]MCW5758809.1 fumarylacetoacetate hydrolase family protein [Phenylobacterium sp.]